MHEFKFNITNKNVHKVSLVVVVNLIELYHTFVCINLIFFLFQELFEKLFSPYGSGDDKSFIYLRTFHRARVTFNKEESAKEAKKDLHGQLFQGYELGVFLVQVIIHIVFFRLEKNLDE